MSRPAPCEFRRTVELDAPIAEVYAFHGNPRNVGAISPPWQAVKVVGASFPARVGEEFTLEIRLFGVLPPLRWRGVWRAADFPGLLMDEGLAGPFAFWRHRHEFAPLPGNRTRMTDHVLYQFPGGWAGKWFGETLGRLQFMMMFADRHARTRRWARERPA